MKVIHDLIQGSDAWLQFRATHFGSSEAAAMLGLSKLTTRTELLRLKKTGVCKEFSDWVQANVLDYGHEVEALARPHVEDIIGSELYAVTCSDGELSASCDGLTMDDETAFEHKQWAQGIAATVQGGTVPEEHMPQCMQILMVTGASKLIFVVSDGTPEKMVWAEVFPDPVWFDRIRAGWAQFAKDLAAYTPVEAAPVAIGRAPETLPALHIEVTGMVTASNLDAFKSNAMAVFGQINRELKTDADFANAEKTVKWCGDVEDRLAAAKQHALSQTASIDVLFKAIDDISAEARAVRLELDKLVKARKEAIRGELVAEGVKALADHVNALNARLGKTYMPISVMAADFGGAIKGKRTVDSLRDAVNTTLANAKIAASAIADNIQANLGTLRELAKEHAFLFADTAQIVLKQPDDCTALVKMRIAEHQAEEDKRLEAEREKIRAEEVAKLARDAEAERLRVAQVLQDANKVWATPTQATAAAAPIANVVPITRAAPAPQATPATPPTLKLGEIGTRLGFSLTGDFLKTLGFEPAARDKSALLFHEVSFPLICAALVAHINSVQAQRAA